MKKEGIPYKGKHTTPLHFSLSTSFPKIQHPNVSLSLTYPFSHDTRNHSLICGREQWGNCFQQKNDPLAMPERCLSSSKLQQSLDEGLWPAAGGGGPHPGDLGPAQGEHTQSIYTCISPTTTSKIILSTMTTSWNEYKVSKYHFGSLLQLQLRQQYLRDLISSKLIQLYSILLIIFSQRLNKITEAKLKIILDLQFYHNGISTDGDLIRWNQYN